MSPRSLPTAKSSPSAGEREQVRRLIARSGLCGLANDTKWDELITAMRASDWRPGYRWKCIDGLPSSWDVEWSYHLPFPMISVEWFDISYQQKVVDHRLPPVTHLIDHSGWIVALLRRIGLDYQIEETMIRIFGYAPRNLDDFNL